MKPQHTLAILTRLQVMLDQLTRQLGMHAILTKLQAMLEIPMRLQVTLDQLMKQRDMPVIITKLLRIQE